MEHPARWNDGVILQVKQELGETKGRVIAIETSMKETRDDVKEILKCISAIPEMRAKLDAHIKEDETADSYVDRNIASVVKKGAWVAITGLIGWCVAKVTGK